MDSFDAMTGDRIQQWLTDWASFLDLWLECGTDAPGPTALLATRKWQEKLPKHGFDPVARRLDTLMLARSTPADRARALLDLLAWQRAAERMQRRPGSEQSD